MLIKCYRNNTGSLTLSNKSTVDQAQLGRRRGGGQECARWSQTGSVLLPRDTHATIKGHARYKYIKGTHTLQCRDLFASCQDTSMQQDRDTYATIYADTHSSV